MLYFYGFTVCYTNIVANAKTVTEGPPSFDIQMLTFHWTCIEIHEIVKNWEM